MIVDLLGLEFAHFCEYPVHRVVVWFGGDGIDDLAGEAYADELGAWGCERFDHAIIEPGSASEAIEIAVESKPWDQDQVDVVWFHQ